LILVLGAIILVAMALGLTVISQLLGEQFKATIGKSDWIKTAVGAFVLASAVNIPFVGFLILLAIVMFSLGMATTWIFGKIRKNKQG
jgi:ABC-type spermidine/putrescine transport system permease subunit I